MQAVALTGTEAKREVLTQKIKISESRAAYLSEQGKHSEAAQFTASVAQLRARLAAL